MIIIDKRYELAAIGCGQAWGEIVEEGLEAAITYFYDNKQDALECYQAYQLTPNSRLGKHWQAAERRANSVLIGRSQHENSMIEILIERRSCC